MGPRRVSALVRSVGSLCPTVSPLTGGAAQLMSCPLVGRKDRDEGFFVRPLVSSPETLPNVVNTVVCAFFARTTICHCSRTLTVIITINTYTVRTFGTSVSLYYLLLYAVTSEYVDSFVSTDTVINTTRKKDDTWRSCLRATSGTS